MVWQIVIFLVVLFGLAFGAMGGLLYWFCQLTDNGWRRRDTVGVASVVLLVASAWLGIHLYCDHEEFALAQKLSNPASMKNFQGALAPWGFEHGTAWCSGYKVDGADVSLFSLEDPAVVYVEINQHGYAAAVYPAEKKPGCFPSIVPGSEARRPTSAEQAHYHQLLAIAGWDKKKSD